jgi:hypothetical protein
MQKTANALITALERLLNLHRELLGVEQKKLGAIIAQDWRELETLLLKSRKLLVKIELAENQRMEVVEHLCCRGDAPLSSVVKSLPDVQKPRVRSCAQKLVEIISRQKLVSETAQNLLKSSLEIINFSISLFSGADGEGKTYSVNGQEKGNEGRYTSLVFDIKA